MSAYPPPPPPQPGSNVPPTGGPTQGVYPNANVGNTGYAYDSRTWKAQAKAQQRMAKAQIRMQREQLRAQARLARRYSVTGPLFLLGLGVVFLLVEMGRISWSGLGVWYGHWWPLLLIGTGLLLLAEWALNGRRGSLLGGGMVALLIFLAFVGWSSSQMQRHMHWDGETFNGWEPNWGPFWGEMHEEDGAPLNTAVTPGGTLLIHDPRGDVSVTGASDDGEVHVTVHKEIHSVSDQDLSKKRDVLQPHFSGGESALELSVGQADNSHADLQVTVPRGVSVTVDAGRGAVNVAEMHAPVAVSAGRGEVNLSGITGTITAHLRDKNGSLSAHSVTGSVSVDGRGGDVNFSDITGPVAMQGEFFGTTHMERVNGTVSFETFRTQFKAARLDGELEIESGSSDAPLQGEAIMGPVVLHTRDRVITLDRVQGNVDINDANGSVTVATVGPLGTISVQSTKGSIDLSVPGSAGFTVDAQTRDGNIENDFGLTASGGDRPTLTGSFGHGGPSVTLSTDDGDVSLRKSKGEPLPPTPPAKPVVSEEPSAPGLPAKPASSKKPVAPKKPDNMKKPDNI